MKLKGCVRPGCFALLGLLLLVMVVPYLLPLPQGDNVDPATLAPPDSQFITIDGFTTLIEQRNEPADTTIILIHGFGGATTNWHETIPALADAGYRVVALDLPGFGLSDKRFDIDYTHPAHADFVAAVMDDLAIEQAVIVGHSMGGSIAAHFAQRHPKKVAGLVFVDGGAFQLQGEGRSTGLAGVLRFPPARRIAQQIILRTTTFDSYYERFQTAYADPDLLTPALYAANMNGLRIADWELALLGVIRDGTNNGLPEPLATADTPTHLIWGEADTWIRLRVGERWAAELDGASLVTIPDAGHLPMMETPAAFNTVLLDFLQTISD